MSVIDTFLYVFKADDKGLQTSQRAAQSAVDKTNASLEKQAKVTESVATNMVKLAGKVTAVVAAYLSWTALRASTTLAAEDTNKLEAEARALRMNSDELRSWQNANTRAGGSAEQMTATLKMLSERTRDPLAALERVADRFKGLNDRQADRLGQRLGLDAGTIEMMRRGREGLKEQLGLQFKLGEVTKEQVEVARKWRIAQADLNVMGEDTRRRIMVMLLPAFTRVTEVMQKVIFWTRENSRFLSLLVPVAAIVGLIGFRTQILMVAKAFRTLTILMMTNPLVLFISALVAVSAAIALVIDDLLAWREGGKSVFGDLIESMPTIKKWGLFILAVYDEVAGGFKRLREVFSTVGSEIKAGMGALFTWLGEKFQWLAGVLEVAKAAIGLVGGAVRTVAGAFTTPVDHVGALQSPQASQPPEYSPYSALKNASGVVTAKDAAASAVGPFGGTPAVVPVTQIVTGRPPVQESAPVSPGESVKRTVEAAQVVIKNADKQPTNSMTSNSISNNAITNKTSSRQTTVTTGPITVNTQATDGEAVSKAIGTSLVSQIKQANDEFDNGISH